MIPNPKAIKESINRFDYPKILNLYYKGPIKKAFDIININTVLYI